jgi:hypothetical protein
MLNVTASDTVQVYSFFYISMPAQYNVHNILIIKIIKSLFDALNNRIHL